jgi:hypothetical protein
MKKRLAELVLEDTQRPVSERGGFAPISEKNADHPPREKDVFAAVASHANAPPKK